jgi:transglutaminase-like putative cysteine protease
MRPQPNVLFAAYRPIQVVINARELSLDADIGLRVSQPLATGLIYTVASRRPEFSAEKLRAAAGAYPPEAAPRYLQLPDTVSGRVRQLTRNLTRPAPTAYGQAVTIRDYLRTIRDNPHPP